MRRTLCGGCGSSDLMPFLDLGTSPLADDFRPSLAEAVSLPRHPVGMCVCTRCWLVQLTEVVPDADLYGQEYGFHTGGSPSAQAYFADYAAWLLRRFPEHVDDGLIVEVACNDGTMLEHLHKAGCRTLGVEPATGPAAAAVDRGLDVVVEPFGVATAETIRAGHGRASVIVANNVLAHVSDVHDFLDGARLLLTGDGVLVVEVQYVMDLLLGNQFDHAYHEHRAFFGMDTLGNLLAEHGFGVRRVDWSPAQGGSIRVTAVPGSWERPEPHPGERWLRSESAYAGVQPRADRIRARLQGLVRAEIEHGRTVVGLAASAKGATLLNWTRLPLAAVHDQTPTKEGRYTPGTGIPITCDPLPAGTTAVLLAHNHLPGILRRERTWLDAGGRLIVPIPQPVVI